MIPRTNFKNCEYYLLILYHMLTSHVVPQLSPFSGVSDEMVE